MDYKKIIKNPSARYSILRALNWIPDSIMLRLQYKIKQGNWPNLKNPKRFTEWLQWYKMNYHNPLMQQCVDKYEVRKYVESKGLGDILIPLIGIYNSVNEITIDSLPKKFVMKTTDGGGGLNVILCKDKDTFNFEDAFIKLTKWLNEKSTTSGREWAYDGIIKPRIIIETLLEDSENPNGVIDYKTLCYNGEPKFIIFDIDRYIDHKRNFYTTNWDFIPVSSDHNYAGDKFPKPKNLERMFSICEHLSKDFPFVRVDLYNINGKIYFGELTFYPWSGYVKFYPDSFDYELGSFFRIK